MLRDSHPTPNLCNVYKKKSEGFALIIAISLMAFILLLLLSIATMAQVQGVRVEHDRYLQLARENARYSILLAMNSLQKHAGPDQRVTTTAEAFGAALEKRNWVGVWETETDADSDGYPDVLPVSGDWLVTSSTPLNHVSDTIPVDSTGKLTDDAFVTLVGGGSVDLTLDSDNNSKPDDIVVAEKLPIPGATTSTSPEGNYAYWIGDQGTKIKLNATNTLDNYTGHSTGASDLLQLAAAQRYGISAIVDASAISNPSSSIIQLGDFPNGEQSALKKLLNLGNLSALGQSMGASYDFSDEQKRLFHHASTQAQGVLSDVRHGGLKWDLSYALDDANRNSTTNYLSNEPEKTLDALGLQNEPELIFDPAWNTHITKTDPGGPYWEQLKSWYNNRVSAGNQLSFLPQRDTQHGYPPVVTYCGLWYHAYTKELPASIPGGSATYNVRWMIMPTVVLANPYNRDLNLPDIFLRIDYASAPNFELDIDTSSGTAIASVMEPTHGSIIGDNPANVQYYVFKIEGGTIPAGEARVYSASNTSAYDWSNYDNNALSAGFLPGAGFYWDIPDANAQGLTEIPSEIRIKARYTSNDLNLTLSESASDFSNADGSLDVFNISYRNQNWGLYSKKDNSGHTPSISSVEASTADDYILASDPAFGYMIMMRFPENKIRSAPIASSDVIDSDNHDLSLPWIAHYNPRANYMGRSPDEWDNASNDSAPKREGTYSNPSYVSKYFDLSSGNDNYRIEHFGTKAFWGSSDTAATGKESVILFGVPDADIPTTSIGELMHYNPSHDFNMSDFRRLNYYSYTVDTDSSGGSSQYIYNNSYPAYAVGNSLADPNLTLNTNSLSTSNLQNDMAYLNWQHKYTGVGSNARKGTQYDISYLLNDALWDRYFFSTVPQSGSLPSPLALANSRMTAYSKAGTSPPTASDLRDMKTAAANLMNEGAFNIHSTSVESWIALLAAFVGTEPNGISSTAAEDQSSFMRRLDDHGSDFNGSNSIADEAYSGYRSLDLDEVRELAESIVSELKQRIEFRRATGGQLFADTAGGPYGSLAEFVNRDPRNSSKSMRQYGLIQDAIVADNNPSSATDNHTDINEDFHSDQPINGWESLHGAWHSDPSSYDLEALQSIPSSTASPGYLMQSDILARIGSVMTNRSDTFLIRAYGNAVNPLTQETRAEAWCEAVVQRLPDYVDDSQAPESTPSGVNADFGRRFVITEFRWLHKKEL